MNTTQMYHLGCMNTGINKSLECFQIVISCEDLILYLFKLVIYYKCRIFDVGTKNPPDLCDTADDEYI